MPRRRSDVESTPVPPTEPAKDPGRQVRDRREREGDPEGLDKSWRGPDEQSGHGAYVGADFGRDTLESAAPEVTGRTPYVGTRMGDWDEDDRARDPSAAPPVPRRSAGSARRRSDRQTKQP